MCVPSRAIIITTRRSRCDRCSGRGSSWCCGSGWRSRWLTAALTGCSWSTGAAPLRSAARPAARQRALCAGLGCRGSGVPAGTPAAAALMPAVVSSNGARLRSLIKQCLAGGIAMRLGAMRRAHASMGAFWAAAGRRSAGAAGEAAAGADARERWRSSWRAPGHGGSSWSTGAAAPFGCLVVWGRY